MSGNTKYGDGSLQKNVNGSNLCAIGMCALQNNDASWNTAVGAYAGTANTTGISNVAIGTNALFLNEIGSYNTAVGSGSLLNNLGDLNTCVGSNALGNNTTGEENTSVGVHSGFNNTVGHKNTFVGSYSGHYNTSGSENTFVGTKSGHENISGSENTFFGIRSGFSNTIGYKNTFLGIRSGHSNIDGSENTFVGAKSGHSNISGSENTFFGAQAGHNNTSGTKNTFIGNYSGSQNTIGHENLFLGINSGANSVVGSKNTFLGAETAAANSIETYNNSTAIGYGATINSSYQIMMGTSDDKVVIPGMAYLTNTSTNYTENSIVNKKYVDIYASGGMKLTTPCDCATTENINLTISPTTVVDGLTLLDGMRVLVRCQNGLGYNTSSSDVSNGIYIYHSTGYERSSDCSLGDDVKGQTCFVKNGTLNKAVIFSQIYYDTSNNNQAIVGTNPLKYDEFYTLNFSIGDGLQVVGNTLQVKPNLTNNAGNSFLTFVGINGGNNDVSYSLDSGTKDILVNGLRVGGSGGIDCSGNVLIVDYTAQSTTTELLVMAQANNNNRVGFVLNPNVGGYNHITQANDNLLAFGDASLNPTSLVIAPWSNTANGIRMTENSIMLGSGGTNTHPTHRLNIDTSKFLITSSAFKVDGNMTTINGNIVIDGSGNYLQFPDGTRQMTSSNTYTEVYTTNMILPLPANCRMIDLLVCGKGGSCGNSNGIYYGGSGSGGNNIWASGIPIGGGEQLNIEFSSTDTTGFTVVNFLGFTLAKAFNGNKGADATVSAGGAGAQINLNPSFGDITFATWVSGIGNAGANGTTSIPGQTSRVSCPKGISIWSATKNGCGQRRQSEANVPGFVSITYHTA
jgi:hypothetical protein